MQRLVFPQKPQSILACYLVVSTAIVLLPTYYFWQSCGIDQQYLGETTGYCTSGIAGVLGMIFLNPFMYVLLTPIIAGAVLTILRIFRWKVSALLVNAAVNALTFLAVYSSIVILFGAWFLYGEDQFYRDKQCYGGNPPSEWLPYCLKGTATANLSAVLAPIEIALSVGSITLVVSYWRYY